ncbi:peptidyl-prolyl cis-trans isomerase pin4 [Glonium stellatum]|uniref:Peptidyl-prolyl cis-trans isomerase n=1 Tax=Glonium stellatum TaxID=574774 RepID=A0A8E2EYW9_9PEZI|nr:peptidyl-prolyl cis-trans isomerase pin4 [Glonium stellatum]
MAPKNKTANSGGTNKGKAKASSSAGDQKDTGPGKLKAATSINVRHILCEKHSKKEGALAKLRDGMKFDEVAKEFSEDKARQGGSLGWKTRGSLIAEFEKVAFELEPSSTGNPKWAEVKTGEGYHIVMVEGRK